MSVDDEDAGSPGAEALLQRLVLRVAEEHQGRSVEEIRETLEAGLAADGFDPQPETWLTTCAEEIAAGRIVITDPELEHEVHRWREQATTPESGGSPPGQE